MNFIEKTAATADVAQMTKDLDDVLDIFGLFKKEQIGLNYRLGASDVWLDNTGSIYDRDEQKFIANETDFSVWNDKIPTYTTKKVQELANSFNFKLGRIRYMRLRPKTGLMVHHDQEARFHFVLKTNPHSYVFLTNPQPGIDVSGWNVPCDGHFYKIDTTKEHFVYNGGDTDRIHLVICAI
jgi:hypothetical protein